jgi:hypothetical protein
MNATRQAALLSVLILDSLKQTRPDDFGLVASILGDTLRNAAFNDAVKASLLPREQQRPRPMERIR